MKTFNEQTVTLKLKRIDVCNLLIATTSMKHSTNSEHWGILHDKLKDIINEYDEKNFEKFMNANK